jgi:tetratricopeptide (TPR) repeat protein
VEKQLKELCFLKGLSMIEEGNASQALEYMEHGMAHGQEYNYLRALTFISIGERAMALKELEQCLGDLTSPLALEALILKTKILWALQREYEGNAAMWQAFKLNPQHTEVQEFLKIVKPKVEEWHSKAATAIFDQDYDKALYCITKGFEVWPDSSRLLLLRAFVYRQQGNFEGALTELEKATRNMDYEQVTAKLKEQIGLTYNDMGQRLYSQELYQEAITLFNEALTYIGSEAGCFINRGDCYRQLSQFDLAMADYNTAMEMDSGNKDLKMRLALLYYSRGYQLLYRNDPEGAIIELSRSIFYENSVADFYAQRATAYLRIQDTQKAFEDVKNALRLNPTHADAKTLLDSFKTKTAASLPQALQTLLRKHGRT